MEKPNEERIAQLEDALFAHALTIKWLMRSVLNKETRDSLRENVCSSIERLYERERVVNHDRVQRVLAEAEALFDPPSPTG